jgi:hypothetical protein
MPSEINLVKRDRSARADKPRSASEKDDRVGLMAQHISASDHVKALLFIELLKRTSNKLGVSDADSLGAGSSGRNCLVAAINTYDSTVTADEVGGQQAHAAGTTAEVEDPHAGTDVCRQQHARRKRLQHARLKVQTFQFIGSMP